MKYFQSDDIPSGNNPKDCIHRYYRVVVDGRVVKEGRHAVKQTRNMTGRIVYVRRWNESTKRWADDDWKLFTQ